MLWKRPLLMSSYFSNANHHTEKTMQTLVFVFLWFNIFRPRENGRHFADNIVKCIFLNENVWILIMISLKFAPKGPINNIPALVLIMAWRRPGDKPLSEPIMVSLPTHICVTRPHWSILLIRLWYIVYISLPLQSYDCSSEATLKNMGKSYESSKD